MDAQTRSRVAFTQRAYRRVVKDLDAIMRFMREDHGLTEDEARAWMKDFVVGHYLPVWRPMNSDDAQTAA